jgi:hypothetical protein
MRAVRSKVSIADPSWGRVASAVKIMYEALRCPGSPVPPPGRLAIVGHRRVLCVWLYAPLHCRGSRSEQFDKITTLEHPPSTRGF